MKSVITIRKSSPDDYSEGAELILMTGEILFKIAFYPEKDKTLNILQRFFQMESNDFTYRNAYIAEIGGETGGLILFMDQKEIEKNKKEMAKKIIKLMGLFGTIRRIPRFIHIENLFQKISDKTIYVKHLGTFERFRNRGIGRSLLEFCKERAKERGLSYLALDVEVENRGAIKFYENIGFEIEKKIESKNFFKRYGFEGLYRMVKRI